MFSKALTHLTESPPYVRDLRFAFFNRRIEQLDADIGSDHLNPRTGSLLVRRLKGSLETAQPLHPHRGEPLLDEVKALKTWLKERPNDGSAFLFNSQKGGRLSRYQIFRIFQDCALAAGLPEDRRFVHILKHSRASHLVGKMDVALVRQAMGHKSLASTMVYAHVRDEDAAREARRVTMELF